MSGGGGSTEADGREADGDYEWVSGLLPVENQEGYWPDYHRRRETGTRRSRSHDGLLPADGYATLGLAGGASVPAAERGHHRLALRWYPDKWSGDDAKFVRIQKAYAALVDGHALLT